MQTSKSDKALRYGGALALTLFSIVCIVTTLFVENVNLRQLEQNLLNRIMYSSTFIENWFYDARSKRFYTHEKKSPNLVILEINDESLNKIGRWPWTRTRHAKILDHLREYGAQVVAFDIVFPEPESAKADGAFSEAIKRFVESGKRKAVALGYDTTDSESDAAENVREEFYFSVLSSPDLEMNQHHWINKNNFVANSLMSEFASFGFISALPDADGVFRHAKLVTQLQMGAEKGFYPSLGLAAFQSFYKNTETDETVEFGKDPNGNDLALFVKSPKRQNAYNLGRNGEMKLRYFGRQEHFVTVSAQDVLNDPNPRANKKLQEIFQGKVVVIGSSAFGAHDLRHLPTDPQAPGMYVHANIFHALDQNFVFQNDYAAVAWSAILCLLGSIVVLLLSRFHNPSIESLGAFAFAGAIYAADYYYFSPQGYFLRLFFALFGVIAPYAWITFLNVFKEAQEKKKIKDAFSRYVAPEIVKEMLSNPDKLKVGGEKKEITMLFSDVRDFTTISERLTPQELSTLLNIYMGKMTDIIFETGGTLDKYIGDAMVGFWGAPVDVKDHAYHAVRGAKQMLEALPAINTEFERRKFPRINVGIGLNTGDASVGNMGSDKIFQYTALGDNMNLASRLESLTKYYGVNLMISEFTLEKLGEKRAEFCIRPLDLVQVKGKSKAVKIYEVLPSWNPLAKESALIANYVNAYENLYLKRKFAEAIAIFSDILAKYPDDKATKKLFHEAEALLKTPPPADWDGVTVMSSK
jgi:adenylate cyclase